MQRDVTRTTSASTHTGSATTRTRSAATRAVLPVLGAILLVLGAVLSCTRTRPSRTTRCIVRRNEDPHAALRAPTRKHTSKRISAAHRRGTPRNGPRRRSRQTHLVLPPLLLVLGALLPVLPPLPVPYTSLPTLTFPYSCLSLTVPFPYPLQFLIPYSSRSLTVTHPLLFPWRAL